MRPLLNSLVPLLLLFSAVAAPAQQAPAFAIQGKVVDAGSGTPLEGADVLARLATDTARVARGRSGADGSFRLVVPQPGRYLVSASHLGRTALAAQPVAVSAGAPLASAGELRLAAVVALEGLQVRAERPPVVHALDRDIYNVQEMPAVSGGAADVMRTLPELDVDIDGKVKLVGGRGVTIHINNRPSPLKGEALTEFIKNLPADRIDRIEVISNPSVRFEGGESAIVNIVLKRGVQLGLSGSTSFNASTRGGNGLSGQVAYQSGKLTFFGGGSGRLQQQDNSSSELRENLHAVPVTFLDQTYSSEGRSLFSGGDLTAEYALDEKGTLWAAGSVFQGNFKNDGTGHYRVLDAGRAPMHTYDRYSNSKSGYGYSNLSAGYRRILEPQRHELSLELRYGGNDSDQDAQYREKTIGQATREGALPEELRVTSGNQGENTWMAKADYTRPWGKGGRMELGLRSEREESTQASRLSVFDSFDGMVPFQNANIAYDFRNDEHSAYVNMSQKLGRLSLQGGLRAERAFSELSAAGEAGEANTFERDYFSVFPTANANYEFARGRSLRVSYSKRVRRPWMWDINPFVLVTDPLNRRLGNPELEPSETHSLNMDLSWRTQHLTLRLSPNYRRTTDEVEYIRTVDAHGVSTTIPQNLTTVTSWGGSLNASARPVQGANISVTIGGNWMQRDADRIASVYSGRGSSSYVNTNGSYQLGRGASLQGSMRLSGPRETPQGHYGSSVYSDLGLRKNLWSENATLNVRLTDPFDLYRSSFRSRDPSFAASGSSRNSWGARSTSVSLTYRFGRMPQKKSTDTGDGPPMPGGPGE